MKIKFNRYEKAAGLFILVAVFGGFLATVGVALRQGWLEEKSSYRVKLNSADGVRQGTLVQMAGLRVGSIKSVELLGGNEVVAIIEVSAEYRGKIRLDSIVHVSRPFVIGEKVFDISPGRDSEPAVEEMAFLPVEMAPDLLELASGKALAPYFSTLGKIAENLKFVAEAFSDSKRMESIITMFDDMGPLLKSANSLTKEGNQLLKGLNRNDRMLATVDNANQLFHELNRTIPVFAKDSPQLAADLAKIATNMAVLTEELRKTLPTFNKIAPSLPKASERAIEALDETVVTLKALQKSFLIRGNVREVREEEAQRDKIRAPADSAPQDSK